MLKTTQTTKTYTSMSTTQTTQSTMTPQQPNYEATMGSDESEDDWEDSDDDNSTEEAPHQLETSDVSPSSPPTFTFQQLQAMNEKLRLKHFIHDADGYTLYRDEPYVNKQYPGLEMNSEIAV